jgi:hypothetical protein
VRHFDYKIGDVFLALPGRQSPKSMEDNFRVQGVPNEARRGSELFLDSARKAEELDHFPETFERQVRQLNDVLLFRIYYSEAFPGK